MFVLSFLFLRLISVSCCCGQKSCFRNLCTPKFIEPSFVPQYVVNHRECSMCAWMYIVCFFFFNLYFYFILLYNTVLVLPYIDMNPPWVYMRSQTFYIYKYNVLKISIKSKCSSVSFRISVALLIFCLEDLSIDMSRVLKFLTIIIVFLSIFPYVCSFMYLGALILGTYRLMSVIFSSCIHPFIIM